MDDPAIGSSMIEAQVEGFERSKSGSKNAWGTVSKGGSPVLASFSTPASRLEEGTGSSEGRDDVRRAFASDCDRKKVSYNGVTVFRYAS
jgi:hypothetical protein